MKYPEKYVISTLVLCNKKPSVLALGFWFLAETYICVVLELIVNACVDHAP